MRLCIVLLECHSWMSYHKRTKSRTKNFVSLVLSYISIFAPKSNIKDGKWCPLLITYPAPPTTLKPHQRLITLYNSRIYTTLDSSSPYPETTVVAHFYWKRLLSLNNTFRHWRWSQRWCWRDHKRRVSRSHFNIVNRIESMYQFYDIDL